MQSTAKPDSPFLDHLPPHTSTYAYQSLEQFASVISAEAERLQQDRGRSQFLVFAHIPNDTFERDLRDPANNIPKYTVETYSEKDNLLIIKMPGGPHEAAYTTVGFSIMGRLREMSRADRGLYGLNHKDTKGTQRAKQADLSFIPVCLPQGRSREWPTLALESGDTDSQEILAANAKWWLSESNGDTKIAMTVDVDKKWKKITMKKFEYSNNTSNLQEDTVTVRNPYDSNILVSGTPLTIPFRKLFLREPVGNENDIVLDDDDMIYIAKAVWAQQGF